MDHLKVLKRAWETTWRYRALWVFGIILALTTAGGGFGGGGDGDGRFQYKLNGEDFFQMGEVPPAEVVSALIAIGVGLACVIVILIIAATIARYVAETALIRMVDDHEETGEQHSVRQGFRMGWSRTAIKLLIGLPVVVVFILLFLLAAAPLLLWITKSTAAGVIGTVAAIGLFFLILFLAIVVGAVLSLLRRFFWRACALEELGVIESIRQGFSVVRQHLKDVGVMWLIMIGVQIGWVVVPRHHPADHRRGSVGWSAGAPGGRAGQPVLGGSSAVDPGGRDRYPDLYPGGGVAVAVPGWADGGVQVQYVDADLPGIARPGELGD